MAVHFLTGFPGFLGAALLPRLLERSAEERVVCLVQPKFIALARSRVEALRATVPGAARRVRLVEGDIAGVGLGLGDPAAIAATVTEVWHLAAVYDLAVPAAVGMRVNVEGTRHVLDFAASCPGLRRVHYVSTCYVSGRFAGTFAERSLEAGQRFNNFYEETKYLAEVEVRRRMSAGLPATIYRPAIVVGDSRTGETQKYDGPYFIVRWLLRQPRLAVMPVVGDARRHYLNVVPRDFVVNAIAHLSRQPRSAGETYQLADPAPLSVEEWLSALATATGRRLVRVPMRRAVAKWSLAHVPGLYRLMRIPPEAVDYFEHPTRYDTAAVTRDLAGTEVEVPPARSYIPRLVEFVRRNPRDVGVMV
ncbi:MAG TPA: SDR family oxidoreductase [Gemmatimonadaceae bacterium]|nr:SDR family oxidoreductase [Gemmatimonadaceae bacterium]